MKRAVYQQLQDVDLSSYTGEWVAVCDRKVVSHGKNVKTVFHAAKKKCQGKIPHLAKVPGKETWIFFHGSFV